MAVGTGSLIIGATAALCLPVGVFLTLVLTATAIGAASAMAEGNSLAHLAVSGALCLILAQVCYVAGLLTRVGCGLGRDGLVRPLLRFCAARRK